MLQLLWSYSLTVSAEWYSKLQASCTVYCHNKTASWKREEMLVARLKLQHHQAIANVLFASLGKPCVPCFYYLTKIPWGLLTDHNKGWEYQKAFVVSTQVVPVRGPHQPMRCCKAPRSWCAVASQKRKWRQHPLDDWFLCLILCAEVSACVLFSNTMEFKNINVAGRSCCTFHTLCTHDFQDDR